MGWRGGVENIAEPVRRGRDVSDLRIDAAGRWAGEMGMGKGTGMRGRMAVALVLLAWAAGASGCGGKEEAMENVPLKELEARAQRMTDDELRREAETYSRLIREKKIELTRWEEEIAGGGGSPGTGEGSRGDLKGRDAETLKVQHEQVGKRLTALVERYQICIRQLVRRGVKVDDLRTD